MNVTDLCEELHNWFDKNEYGRHYGVLSGTFEIHNGIIDLSDFLLDGQYYRIIGSVFNRGVHKYGDINDILHDETFTGEIYALSIPKTVLDLLEEINKWLDKYGDSANSPYLSESFGGYSVAYNVSNGNISNSWQSIFANRLNRWRKL